MRELLICMFPKGPEVRELLICMFPKGPEGENFF